MANICACMRCVSVLLLFLSHLPGPVLLEVSSCSVSIQLMFCLTLKFESRDDWDDWLGVILYANAVQS